MGDVEQRVVEVRDRVQLAGAHSDIGILRRLLLLGDHREVRVAVLLDLPKADVRRPEIPLPRLHADGITEEGLVRASLEPLGGRVPATQAQLRSRKSRNAR